jgi:hypothetical protein
VTKITYRCKKVIDIAWEMTQIVLFLNYSVEKDISGNNDGPSPKRTARHCFVGLPVRYYGVQVTVGIQKPSVAPAARSTDLMHESTPALS